MTQTEMIQLADQICQLPASQYGEFADLLFDRIEANYSVILVTEISSQLLGAGVDVRPICKKKHPT